MKKLNIINQENFIDVHKAFNPTTAKYVLFTIVHGTYTKMNYILSHKINLNKIKRTELIESVHFDYNVTQLLISNKQKDNREISKYFNLNT